MRRRVTRTEEAFQMAPMIDMVFLLLVFFMTVSTLAKEARPEVDLPVSRTASVPQEVPPRGLVTLVPAGDVYQLYWYNLPVKQEELQRILEQGDAPDQREILLRGPPQAPWREWEPVLGILRENGVEQITFSTLEG